MIVDLFAGPGGWDEGLRLLGLSATGIEIDPSACSTAELAGHPRICADVAESPIPEGITGLIASPPCQGFSTAGKGLGRGDRDQIMRVAIELAAGTDTRQVRGEMCADHRSMLTVEPLRWALAASPDWIALEQVPAVLPLWELFADILRFRGYFVDTGILSAEQYGVPQTRKRAYLVASRARMAKLPAPTHQKYRKGVPAQAKDGLLPWVSMAQALGWEPGLAGFPRRADEGRPSIEIGGERYRERDLRSVDEPAFAVTEKARSWQRWLASSGRTGEGRPRPIDEPAPTQTAAGNSYWLGEGGEWRAAPAWSMVQNARKHATVRRGDEPSATITGGHDFAERRWMPGAQRVAPDEVSVLQGFPATYPWQGTRTKQFEQIGNAVCPPVAAAVLAEAMGLEVAIAA